MVFAGGVHLVSGGVIDSPKLYGIRRSDGKQMWSGYLIPVAIDAFKPGLAVLAGYRFGKQPIRWDPYGSSVQGFGLRIEIRDYTKGRVLARTQLFQARDATDLAAVGSRVLLLNGKKLSLYRAY
jgi:hypothetical protein